ncbi:hypothetical protein BWQ96_00537 [Gracilariopsis chorda]|uniref:Uncharacterized protein n=1 Tax=Gracilariopsis chorda TaxID=448386 RepID=A0A2V3J5I3_9FLOR|nr:hypothetical protein BWQ96_00537 [Gracilariopsis chorda]|eukprot:PXF49659.1 hypothetical protein BWQ96_00537 [Gracilariopsis chorda]
MPPTQPTGYLFEPMPMNSDVLVDKYQEIANDVAMGEPEEEVDAPNDGTDVEYIPAAMQESAPAPAPLPTLQGEAELHCLRCLLLDADVSPGQIPNSRQQMVNLLRDHMGNMPNTNAYRFR